MYYTIWLISCQWSLFCVQVSKNGMVNSVFTLFELSSGTDTEGEGKQVHKWINFMLLCCFVIYSPSVIPTPNASNACSCTMEPSGGSQHQYFPLVVRYSLRRHNNRMKSASVL